MEHATVMAQRTNIMHLMVFDTYLCIYHGITRSMAIWFRHSFLTEDFISIPYKERLTTLCGIALNQYNVIHIDIQQFVSKYPVIKDMVARLTKELLFDVKMEMPDVTLFDETDLVRTSKDIFSQKREKFIFIIDEWDSIFRVHRDNATAPKEYLDFLRDFLKGQPYVALAYMTDILPIKKYGQHSALNMFKEYAMTN